MKLNRIKPIRGRTGERGVALLVTIMVITLVGILAVEMHSITMVDLHISENIAKDTKLYFLAKSGVEAARAILTEDKKDNAFDDLSETWANGGGPIVYPVASSVVQISIVDEERKLPVNSLVLETEEGPVIHEPLYNALKSLLTMLELEPDIADAVVDWIDKDSMTLGTNGAEDPFYKNLKPPYEASDTILFTTDELRMVRGIEPEVYAKLLPYLSIYSSSQINKSQEGKENTYGPMVNINTASRDILMAVSDEITEERAKDIIDYRTDKPFETQAQVANYMKDFSPPLENPQEVASRFRTDSVSFTVLSYAMMPEGGEEVQDSEGSEASQMDTTAEEDVRESASRKGNTKGIMAVINRESESATKPIYWKID